jgi:hypothetical protein
VLPAIQLLWELWQPDVERKYEDMINEGEYTREVPAEYTCFDDGLPEEEVACPPEGGVACPPEEERAHPAKPKRAKVTKRPREEWHEPPVQLNTTVFKLNLPENPNGGKVVGPLKIQNRQTDCFGIAVLQALVAFGSCDQLWDHDRLGHYEAPRSLQVSLSAVVSSARRSFSSRSSELIAGTPAALKNGALAAGEIADNQVKGTVIVVSGVLDMGKELGCSLIRTIGDMGGVVQEGLAFRAARTPNRTSAVLLKPPLQRPLGLAGHSTASKLRSQSRLR